ncbi:MAG: aminomethyl transferase family protein [Planctomycetes bacterium]|nr:aminomethyl transferase family protein [Planctomycetota bacterium]NBY02204.1 aminomethyl transferase family protein [Planctomycetota bacterium]
MEQNKGLVDLLVSQGAIYGVETNPPLSFGDIEKEYSAARRDSVVFDVSNRSKIEMTGPDVPAFLNNICTNQVADLPLGGGCEAFLTTAKAKAVAHIRVYHIQLADGRHAYWVDGAPGQNRKIEEHLDHYLISEQVAFADRTADYAQFLLVGPKSKSLISKLIQEEVPELELHDFLNRSVNDAGSCQIRFEPDFNIPAYEIVCLKSRAVKVWEALTSSGAIPGGTEALEILRVEAGFPLAGKEIEETTFIPELNRAAKAICSTKGCYLGQEPIVMARDRGQVNRLLFGLFLEKNMVKQGSLVFRDGNEVGRVTSSLYSPLLKKNIALAYLRRGNHDLGTSFQVECDGTKQSAVSCSLPFSF